jgi:hypothetical protein
VTHIGVLLGLLSNRFARTHEGLLDSTHVHFFDRDGLKALCAAAGFRVTEENAVRRNLLDTEFAQLDFQSFPRAVGQFVQGLPDSSIYQFIWRLAPLGVDSAVTQVTPERAPMLAPVSAVPRFAIQLYLDRGNGFSEEASEFAFGEQVEGLQALSFRISDGHSVQAMRVDFGDRVGAFELDGIDALDSEGRSVWHWQGDWSEKLRTNDCKLTGALGRNGGQIVRCTGRDPWVSLPLDPGAWASVCVLRVRMGNPVAYADAMFLKVDQMAAEFATALSRADTRFDSLAVQLRELIAAKDQLQTANNQLNAVNHDLALELSTARNQYAEILRSSSWRLTAGLRAVSRWISKLRA